ncbi:hypothetical protein HHK36_020547 [Tetracentron sinense]|uniref:Pentatricopeptide repeat-containing protein n=1 Tax=Tetracentron sinense TaxID=13715 RepID=A0A835DBQ1_TETSI|nr:hypothetical protein HHK36_020547 [Tetracentron sinense]
MIFGYGNNGKVDIARELFDRIPERNVVSWMTIICGYVKVCDMVEAQALFETMPTKDLASWKIMVSIESHAHAMAHMEATLASNSQLNHKRKSRGRSRFTAEEKLKETITLLAVGNSRYGETIVRENVGPSHFSNLQLVTSLIDMYAKCGSIVKAFHVFEKAYQKDLVCYSTMVTAFANHGMGQDAIALFDVMHEANIKSDGITFLGILSACNHGGLVDEGKSFFKRMTEEFSIQPSNRHYTCVIDLLLVGSTAMLSWPELQQTSYSRLSQIILVKLFNGGGTEAKICDFMVVMLGINQLSFGLM